jgi:hypothetical protein
MQIMSGVFLSWLFIMLASSLGCISWVGFHGSAAGCAQLVRNKLLKNKQRQAKRKVGFIMCSSKINEWQQDSNEDSWV